jgi:putative addiction module component (TIGR02574 family)
MTQLEIAKLPLQERLRLMESLWDSICHESTGEPSMPTWHAAVLDERVARLDAGEEAVSTWEEAKQRLRAQTEPR